MSAGASKAEVMCDTSRHLTPDENPNAGMYVLVCNVAVRRSHECRHGQLRRGEGGMVARQAWVCPAQ